MTGMSLVVINAGGFLESNPEPIKLALIAKMNFFQKRKLSVFAREYVMSNLALIKLSASAFLVINLFILPRLA